MPAVTVVIPNWNGMELLSSISLPALAAQTLQDFVITVVDNGSTDGSVSYLKSQWPHVRVKELPTNAGFAAAVNRGVASARSNLIALINNDVALDDRWLEQMVDGASRFPEAGSFASKVKDFDEREVIATVGDCVTAGARIFWRGAGERDQGQYDEVSTVFSACAAAALYRKTALDLVGSFDEDFFAYLEDVDWGFRAQLLGFSCVYIPSAVAYHVGGATSTQVSGLQTSLIARNTYWLVLKDFPWKISLGGSLRISFRLGRRFLRVFRYGHRRQAVSAAFTALRMTPAMARKRRWIQSRRRLSDHQLRNILCAEVSLSAKARARIGNWLIRGSDEGG
jgi:GT2 family glycosyltransferase